MTNLATALKDETTRLARKVLRADTEALRKTASAQRAEIATMKRRIADLERAVSVLSKAHTASRAKQERAAEKGTRFRFSSGGLASNRQRLGLSAADYGLLVGVTGQSIYGWEQGTSAPREKNLAALAELRGMGKKAVAAKLAALQTA